MCSSEWHSPLAASRTRTSCRTRSPRSTVSTFQSCLAPKSTAACVFIDTSLQSEYGTDELFSPASSSKPGNGQHRDRALPRPGAHHDVGDEQRGLSVEA